MGYGTIDNSYASATTTGNVEVGGLVGENWFANVYNSYANGSATGDSRVGGLVGHDVGYDTVSNSFAVGVAISTGDTAGGVFGRVDNQSETITNDWWYNPIDSVGVGNGPLPGVSPAGSVSDFFKTSQGVYTGASPWDFTNIWNSDETSYPFLRWQRRSRISASGVFNHALIN